MNSAKFIAIACSLFLYASAITASAQVLYLDFGPNNGTDGNNTLPENANGLYWNNINNASNTASPQGLSDQFNNGTGIYIQMLDSMSTNGIRNGALLNPSPDLLGDLAVNTATQDYFFTENKGRFALRGLDTGKGYRFTFFASRDNTERRTSRYTIQGSTSHTYWLQTSGDNIGTNIANSNDNKVIQTEIYQPTNNNEIVIIVEKASHSFAYINALKIEVFDDTNFPPAQSNINANCPSLDEHKIVFMGSSVAWGYASDDPGGPFDHYIAFNENRSGYPYHFSRQLDNSFNKDLHDTGKEQRWWVSNISVPGDTTSKVLARWDNDLLPQCAKYVVYGLSLANEGIINDASAFNRFRTNMETIIQQTRDHGMVPIIVNNYANNGYDDIRYNRIIDMDFFIHVWDAPSINVLGALDNLQGHFPEGYYADAGHPNNSGYYEMFTTIVPSLFLALDTNKPRPTKVPTTNVTLTPGEQLAFQPEANLRSMTLTADINTDAQGDVMVFHTQDGMTKLAINSAGQLEYTSENRNVTVGPGVVNDNSWHTVTLSHHYAQGVTMLSIDGQQQANTISERLEMHTFTLGSVSISANLHARNLLFHRSGMTSREIQSLSNGDLLQSSLEIYSPLDGQSKAIDEALENLAQSTNTLHFQDAAGGPEGYVHCANENGTCMFSGTASVAYGANGIFNHLNVTDGIACNNTEFGDPIFGVVKACYYQLRGGPIDFTFCASENGTCSFKGTASIAYGVDGVFNYRDATNSISCNNNTFGDPAFGAVKACYYQLTRDGGLK